MDMETLLQVIYYTIMIIVATATVAKLVSKSVASASNTVVASNVKVMENAMERASIERNYGHRIDTLERNQVELDERMSRQLDELKQEVSAGNARVEGRLDKLYELIVKGNSR